MKLRVFTFVIAVFASIVPNSCASGSGEASGSEERDPFSFEEIRKQNPSAAADLRQFEASDGALLAFRHYPAPGGAEGAVILYHGGGAHGGAGYAALAGHWSEQSGYEVYVMDIRGHGASEGERGDSPSRNRVFKDVADAIAMVRAESPGLGISLAGHSSGAGLITHYASSRWADDGIAAYLLIAPHLGFRSETQRTDPPSGFADVKIWPFVINSMSLKLFCGHHPSISLNYPDRIRERDPLLLHSYSVNMSNALTPRSPKKQLAAIAERTRIWIGSEDESIDPELLRAFVAENAPAAAFTVLPGVNHLGILTEPIDF